MMRQLFIYLWEHFFIFKSEDYQYDSLKILMTKIDFGEQVGQLLIDSV